MALAWSRERAHLLPRRLKISRPEETKKRLIDRVEIASTFLVASKKSEGFLGLSAVNPVMGGTARMQERGMDRVHWI